jgi:hypothetical protein
MSILNQLVFVPGRCDEMYAENALSAISTDYKKQFVQLLTSRLGEIEKESKQKRVEKVIKKLQQ